MTVFSMGCKPSLFPTTMSQRESKKSALRPGAVIVRIVEIDVHRVDILGAGGEIFTTCPSRPKCSTREVYSSSGSQIRISSWVTSMTLEISRLAEKDLPLPGVPSISPLGFFNSFRSTMIKLLERAFRP